MKVDAPVPETSSGIRTMTIEAFADTILPGAKRHPEDRAVAGAAPGPGATVCGAVELLELPGGGLAPTLDALVGSLNEHADEYIATHGLRPDRDVPSFVALPFEDRTALVRGLTAPDHPEKQLWVGLALFSYMAFDSAAHLRTVDALADRHPGLTFLGFRQPDADGLFRFPRFSYGRKLADPHPQTTQTGSPR
ncbi:DUF5987 family protein [Rhizomonospora bruguierae]|uniref:DUF5987 family protein n=1 Tax=Rhizomonospora bruguierae TaxID=1581705 RepID=UPI001BCEC883|nr:DUF5987 family protein [Micromonospora sp. NBRC 107566]